MGQQRENTLVAGRNLHEYYDIVGSLPLELVIQIVYHLDEADIVRSQRVSRRWREIFSCDEIIKRVLSRTLAGLGIVETTNVTAADTVRHFQWLHNLQFARPMKKVFLPWPDGWMESPYRLAYHSRRLCYVIQKDGCTKVAMLDLETGKKSIWDSDSGEAIQDLELSDRYLVAITHRTRSIIVWDIHTSQRWSGKHAPGVIHNIAIEKDKVVIFPFSFEESVPFWVWDLGADHVLSIGSFNSVIFWHMDASENVLVVFEINRDYEPPLVQQTKWSLNGGEQLDCKTFPLSLDGRSVSGKNIFRAWHRTYGRKTIAQLSVKKAGVAMLLTYDHALDRLSTRWINCGDPIDDYDFSGPRIPLCPRFFYRWATWCERIAVSDTATGTTTLHPYQLDTREVSARRSLNARRPLPFYSPNVTRIVMSCFVPFGDNEVFGLASDDGTQLWFFNPDFTPDLPFTQPLSYLGGQ